MIRLKLNGKWYKDFTTVNVNLNINTIASTFKFTGFKQFFDVLQYDRCDVYFDNERIITGTILNPAFTYSKKPTLLSISGYSKTGILEDVNYPLSLYPTQFDGLSLIQITRKICNYFNLKLKVFNNAITPASIPFEKVSISSTETIRGFLAKLANQRGITFTHDNYGRVLLYRIQAKIKPALNLKIGDSLSATYTPNAQGFHSSITLLRQTKLDDNNTQQLKRTSPFIKGVNRPAVKTLNDGDELGEALNRLICLEARNHTLKLTYEGFLNVRSGFYINLEAPQILKKVTKFIIESVDFTADKKKRTTTMNIVLPCVYTGVLPRTTPFK